MAVESKLSNAEPIVEKPKYPYIGISKDGKGESILFTSEGKGFWMRGETFKVGTHCDHWEESQFIPLSPSESITLRNV